MDDENEQANARLGTVLRGKYHLDRVLGVGGMAAVYAATHRNTKQFAVKMLHHDLSKNADTRARFLREGYAANSVNHPGAVQVLDDDTTEDGGAFLVMELLEGAPIDTLYESRGKLAASEVIAIGVELLDVLAAAHEKAIVHRDIKPANLFLTNEPRVKILDFGIARVRDFATSGSMTMTGALLGTPAFMPPEQANGEIEQIDGLTDQWAAAATLFTLLTGHYVHEGGTAQHLMIKAATTPPRSITTVGDVPAPLAHVIDRALSFDRLQRWPSCAEMKIALAHAHFQIFGRPVSPLNLASLTGQPVTREHSISTPPVAGTINSYVMRAAPPQEFRRDGTLPAMATSSIPGVPKPHSMRGIWIVVTAVSLAAVVAIGIFVRHSRLEKSGAAIVDRSTIANGATGANGAAIDSTTASATTATATTAAIASANESAAPSSTSSSVSARVAPSTSSSGSKTGRAAKNPAITTTAKLPAKDCNPNYTLDADGNKHFKPECF